MLPRTAIALALSGAPLAYSTLLHAASYSGVITTLNLTLPDPDSDSSASLTTVSETDACGGSPAWLEVDDGVVYCSDEGLTTVSGSVATLRGGGGLEGLGRLETTQGPVSSVRFGESGLAVAHYASSMVTVYDISNPAAPTQNQNHTFTLDEPGANPDRQDAPHPHQVVLDPTGAFVVVPDLGADLVRVFAVGDGVSLVEEEALEIEAGSGPRHVAFTEREGEGEGEGAVVMYVICELTNMIYGFGVEYTDGGMAFEELFSIPTHGEGEQVPEGASAAEILVSPDNNFLTISSRTESSHEIPDPSNPDTDIPSDPLVTFSIGASGELTLVQDAPAGGMGPRQFAFNEAGDLVAVALQADGRVVVMRRDVETGEVGEVVAAVELEGDVTCVVFDE